MSSQDLLWLGGAFYHQWEWYETPSVGESGSNMNDEDGDARRDG
jgi:hypothetical protein